MEPFNPLQVPTVILKQGGPYMIKIKAKCNDKNSPICLFNHISHHSQHIATENIQANYFSP